MGMVVCIWCRSKEDSIIGIGNDIPWDEIEDKKNFCDIVKDNLVVMGRKTYESMSDDFINTNKIFVMSNNKEYEVKNKKLHTLITKQNELKDVEDDLYVSGGSYVYELFLTGKEALKPHIIVDCVYEGELLKKEGKVIKIDNLMGEVEKKYRRVTPFYKKGNVLSSVLIRKGEFVEQSVLKRIIGILENNAEVL